MANQKKARKVGRPPLPKGQAKGRIVPIRLTHDERTRYEKEARSNGQTLSQWVRSTLSAKVNNNA
ncbi:MAG TPA: hypothetical protein VED86_02645 [archaeon]|nr:hypothetical protein [archaeon]